MEAITSLKNSPCVDIYDLNSRIIKEISDILAYPLTIIINECFARGVFPDALKISKVIPLFKKGDPQLLDNYRPISIIPIFAKLIEILLKARVTQYFENNSLLCSCQFGFRNNYSTTKAIMQIVSDIVQGLEEGKHSAITMCDLTKAFDCIAHDRLLDKMNIYGIRGLPLELFKSYLKGRSQCVVINCKQSECVHVNHGVPQGSVLGPLLFIIYINDLYKFLLPNKCVMFADDTTLICSDKILKNLLHCSKEMVKKAEDWFTINKLKLNQQKTQEIIFSSHSDISQGNSAKLLGIVLDDKLNWSSHVEQLSRKLSSVIFLFRQMKSILNLDILKLSYFSLFHSHLTYGILIWGNSYHANKVFRLQKKVVRLMTGAGFREHCRSLFIDTGIMPLPSAYIYHTLIYIHKNINVFIPQSASHNYPTRSGDLLKKPRFRLAKSEKNSIDLNIYNKLPSKIRSLNFSCFKRIVKSFILRNCFYSVTEYLNSTHFSDLL